MAVFSVPRVVHLPIDRRFVADIFDDEEHYHHGNDDSLKQRVGSQLVATRFTISMISHVRLSRQGRRKLTLMAADDRRRFFATSIPVSRTAGQHDYPQLYSSGFLHSQYHELVKKHNVQVDPYQVRALESLERLRDELLAKAPKELEPQATAAATSHSSSSSFFGGWLSTAQETVQETIRPSIKGAYLHGGVGCGKVCGLEYSM